MGKGYTGLNSDAMCYDREYVSHHIGEIRILWVFYDSADATSQSYLVSEMNC